MSERIYSRTDVETLARTVLDWWQGGSDSGRNAYVECNFCEARAHSSGSLNNHQDIRHKSDCPVLIAKDVLT